MSALDVLLTNLPYLLKAATSTLGLAAVSILGATLLALLITVQIAQGGRTSRTLFDAYLFFVRGVPLLVLIVFVYYVLPRSGLALPAFWAVCAVLIAYYAAFMTEVFRAGLDALPKAQWDAATSLGLSPTIMFRRVLFPQAARLAAPAHVNLCASLVKSTSLASVVGLWELTLASLEVVERTLAPFSIFLGAAMIYFVICFSLSLLSKKLEKEALHGH
jgi:His/Glu/Gln/Arg/opine family amino acid ABC transporter permease subunit